MSYGLIKLDRVVGKSYALKDWHRIAAYARQHGQEVLVEKHQPGEKYGMRRIDRASLGLIADLEARGYDVREALPDLII